MTAALHELKIWSETDDEGPSTLTRRDNLWVAHMTGTCTNLTVPKLESTLDVSPDKLAAFFASMKQLETLRLGGEMNTVLDRGALTAILRAPSLKHLSLDYILDISFVQELVEDSSSAEILPSIVKMDVTFADADDHAAGFLLGMVANVEELSLRLRSIAPQQAATIHPSLFVAIQSLPKLKVLTLRLSPMVRLSFRDLLSINILSAHVYIISPLSEHELSQGPVQLLLTGRDLANYPITLDLLETLESFALPQVVEVTHDEATLIIHKVMNLSLSHMPLFQLRVEEASSFGWPSIEDYQLSQRQQTIWLASTKSFAPDPALWIHRDLSLFFNANGEQIPLNEVVEQGSYNHLT